MNTQKKLEELNDLLKKAKDLASQIEDEAREQKEFCRNQMFEALQSKDEAWVKTYESPLNYQTQLEAKASIIRTSICGLLRYNNLLNIPVF